MENDPNDHHADLLATWETKHMSFQVFLVGKGQRIEDQTLEEAEFPDDCIVIRRTKFFTTNGVTVRSTRYELGCPLGMSNMALICRKSGIQEGRRRERVNQLMVNDQGGAA